MGKPIQRPPAQHTGCDSGCAGGLRAPIRVRVPQHRSIAPALFVGICLTTASAFAQSTFQAGASYWSPGAGGTVAAGTAGGVQGTERDLEEDMGISDAGNVWTLSASVGLEHQFVLDYTDLSAEGRTSLESATDIEGIAFIPGLELASTVSASLLRAAYRYAGSSDSLRSGFLLGLQSVQMGVESGGDDLPETHSEIDLIMPCTGVFAEWQPTSFVTLSASLTGGAWDLSGTSASMLDAVFSATVQLHPIFVGAGYRYLSLQGDDTGETLEVDLLFSGPLWYAGIAF